MKRLDVIWLKGKTGERVFAGGWHRPTRTSIVGEIVVDAQRPHRQAATRSYPKTKNFYDHVIGT